MTKIGDKVICPQCGSNHTICLGGAHYVFNSNPKGMGDKHIEVGYQCKDCGNVWHE